MSRRSIQIAETLDRSKELWGETCVAVYALGVCGRPANQGAHVLPQDVLHLARYGGEVVHHPLNIKPTCSLGCNQKLEIDCRTQPLLADRWAAVIRQVIAGEITTDDAKAELAMIDAERRVA